LLGLRKIRTLIEGPEWQPSKAVLVIPKRWDAMFRAAAWSIATKPRENSTPFLSENFRVMEAVFPDVARLFVYYRIEDNDDICTLLWVDALGGQKIPNRVG
jgi:hypothetical protein